MDVEKATILVVSGAAEKVMPRNMFPEKSTEEIVEVQEWQRVQRTRRRAHQESWAVERHATKDPGMRSTLKRLALSVIPSRSLRRKLRRTQNKTRHHTLQSLTEVQVSPQPMTRTPALAT